MEDDNKEGEGALSCIGKQGRVATKLAEQQIHKELKSGRKLKAMVRDQSPLATGLGYLVISLRRRVETIARMEGKILMTHLSRFMSRAMMQILRRVRRMS